MLIDSLSFNATDNLTACLRATRPQTTFIGRPSGGGTGAPRRAATLAHNSFEVGFSTIRVYGQRSGCCVGAEAPLMTRWRRPPPPSPAPAQRRQPRRHLTAQRVTGGHPALRSAIAAELTDLAAAA
ncbi:MAG: hypothetical protein IT370_30250 [Deltaproteobacteria bacterium]|nr:hypothetical protein [Deltaproteobacteria bacterium]